MLITHDEAHPTTTESDGKKVGKSFFLVRALNFFFLSRRSASAQSHDELIGGEKNDFALFASFSRPLLGGSKKTRASEAAKKSEAFN